MVTKNIIVNAKDYEFEINFKEYETKNYNIEIDTSDYSYTFETSDNVFNLEADTSEVLKQRIPNTPPNLFLYLEDIIKVYEIFSSMIIETRNIIDNFKTNDNQIKIFLKALTSSINPITSLIKNSTKISQSNINASNPINLSFATIKQDYFNVLVNYKVSFTKGLQDSLRTNDSEIFEIQKKLQSNLSATDDIFGQANADDDQTLQFFKVMTHGFRASQVFFRTFNANRSFQINTKLNESISISTDKLILENVKNEDFKVYSFNKNLNEQFKTSSTKTIVFLKEKESLYKINELIGKTLEKDFEETLIFTTSIVTDVYNLSSQSSSTSLTENITLTYGLNREEPLILVKEFKKEFEKVFNENLYTASLFSKNVDFNRPNLIETNLSEEISKQNSKLVILNTLVSEAIGKTLEKDFTDTLLIDSIFDFEVENITTIDSSSNLIDNTILNYIKSKEELLTISFTFNKELTKEFTEVILLDSILQNISSGVLQEPSSSTNLGDSLQQTFNKVLNNNFITNSSLIFTLTKNLQDNTKTSFELTKLIDITKLSQFNVNSNIEKILERDLSDNTDLDESRVIVFNKIISSTPKLSSSLTKNFTNVVQNDINSNDNFSYSSTKPIVSNSGISSTTSKTVNLAKGEVISTSRTLRFFKQNYVSQDYFAEEYVGEVITI